MTIKDIAKEAGYAVGTVSRVLNNQTKVSKVAKAKILEVVNKHGFVLNNSAKNLKRQFNKSIVILVKGNSNQLFSSMVEEMQKLIVENDYYVVVNYFDEDEDEVGIALRTVLEQKPMGLIFLGGIKENFQNLFGKITTPSVLVTNSAEDYNFENLSSVSIDDKKSAVDAVDYLISKGHRNIGVLGGKIEVSDISNSRFLGVVESFDKINLSFDSKKQYQNSRYSMKSGYKNMIKLLEINPDITAVFAMADVIALGAMRAITDSGKKIPQDISVIGFDGLEISLYSNPRLTTVEQPKKDIAKETIALLLDKIENNAKSRHIIVKHVITVGDSVDNK